MHDTLVTKFKWFWGWQDDKQEAWLDAMSRAGLQLQNIKAFGRYVFKVNPEKGYVYRMDFDRTSGKDSDYFSLIEEAGWEHVIQVLGWHYWRKVTSEERTVEIFTDNESKIKKYERFLPSLLVPTTAPMFIVLALFARFPGRHPQWFVILTISLYAFWFLFLGINVIKVIQRINELKRMKSL